MPWLPTWTASRLWRRAGASILPAWTTGFWSEDVELQESRRESSGFKAADKLGTDCWRWEVTSLLRSILDRNLDLESRIEVQRSFRRLPIALDTGIRQY